MHTTLSPCVYILKQAPYITATAYFQKEKDGVLQPYTLGTKKVDMPSEINTDNTVATFRKMQGKKQKNYGEEPQFFRLDVINDACVIPRNASQNHSVCHF